MCQPLTQTLNLTWRALFRCIQTLKCVNPTFMVGGAVRGGEGGYSPTGTFEMFSSSCFLERR